MLGIPFLKLLNPSCGIDQFLLSGEERVAGRANFNGHLCID